MRLTHWTRALTVMALLALFCGCIVLPPTLLVSPLAVDFSPSESVKNIRIENTGSGVLDWEASVEDAPWLTLSIPELGKQGTELSGNLETGVQFITLEIDRTQLPAGRVTTGTVSFTSNGGNQSTNVSVSQSLAAELNVFPGLLSFDATTTRQTFQITNNGDETLNWAVDVPDSTPWITVSPASGTLTQLGATQQVAVTINRTGLPIGTPLTELLITSNGGDYVLLLDTVISPFSVSSQSIDFGGITDTAESSITITNITAEAIDLEILPTSNDPTSWFQASPPSFSLDPGESRSVNLTAEPDGLAVGNYTGDLFVFMPSIDFSVVVPARMSVIEVPPLEVSTNTIDFGIISQETTHPLTITNVGVLPIDFTVSIPAFDQQWLRTDVTAGTLNNTVVITFTANPLAVDPGVYESNVSVAYATGSETIVVTMERPEPAGLSVVPRNVDFGTAGTRETVAVFNKGIGTIDWSIALAGFPAWLTIEEATGPVLSGTVTQNTDLITIVVDRANAPAGQFNLSHTFSVAGSIPQELPLEPLPLPPVSVTVTAAIPRVPVMELIAQGIDDFGVPFVNLDSDLTEVTFVIRNTGNGTLNWMIDPAQLPAWITSITPTQDSLDPGRQQSIKITVSRDSLSVGGAQADLTITSNAPDQQLLLLRVEILVEPEISIATAPSAMAFSITSISQTLGIANSGDTGTKLDFQVTSSKEWLSVFPETGSSIGVPPGIILDFQPISVTVDRSQLDGAGAAAKLVITAFITDPLSGQRIPDPDVVPVEVNVSVEAPELTIETALPRLRIPSQVRSVLLLRNIKSQVLPIPDSQVSAVGGLFDIAENDDPLAVEETSQFLKQGNRLRTNALILLDYSGSMLAAAQVLEDNGELPQVDGNDALQTLYETTVSEMIADLDPNYRVALAVFNERTFGSEASPVRAITGEGSPDTFTTDKDVLLARLNAINVLDHGATQLLPAVISAADLLDNEDSQFNYIPFDDADVRALVCVTDGRLTTPPGNITDAQDALRNSFVRFMAVGWGEKVASDPLVRLSAASGGHFYATRNRPTGEIDPFGAPVREPVFAELADWCQTLEDDTCDQSVPKDLASQVILSYVTLKEARNIKVNGKLSFNDPNDSNSTCLEEQGSINGEYEQTQLDFESIAGDVRLGQISLRNLGLNPDGSYTIVVHADYIPRNINRFVFEITPEAGIFGDITPDFAVAAVPNSQGGLIGDWDFVQSGVQFTASSPTGTPLTYGDFGELMRITITDYDLPFFVNFQVNEPVHSASFNSHYFTYPDSLLVTDETPFLAPSFPAPFIGAGSIPLPASTDPVVFDLGTGIDTLQLELLNLGGSHVRPGFEPGDPLVDVGLAFVLNIGTIDAIVTDSRFVQPQEGFVTGTRDPTVISIPVNRSLPPGQYEGIFNFTYTFGSLGLETEGEGIVLRFEVAPPVLLVSTNFLDFQSTISDLQLTITNTGQSELIWAIEPGLLPQWLSLDRFAGSLGPNQSDTFFVRLFRSALPEGINQTTLNITSSTEGQSAAITVQANGGGP
ncbi:MAG: VWA domain-containing protein [Candidatus Hydrogenedentes bacterium]|nr:VWA domain-containing protein [Candidatus Hydrogenedentota bacterium]